MSKENIETVITRLYDKVNSLGHVKMEIDGQDLERILELSKSYLNLTDKIAEHQLNETSDLLTIGELVLTETGMWG